MQAYGDRLPTVGEIVVLADGGNRATYATVLPHLDDHDDATLCDRCGTKISYSHAGRSCVTGKIIHIDYNCLAE